LTTALDTLENEQQLSPEEMAEALRSYDQAGFGHPLSTGEYKT